MNTPTAGPDIVCREGDPDYDVTWPWQSGRLRPGLTCVFRVRNEARNLPWVLPPILSAVQEVVFVDNNSDDGTPELALSLARELGASDRFRLLHYPHAVARAGSEHLATAADSVHSLTHFYNWCFAQVRTTYSMKWDGDMVLTPEGVGIIRDLSWQLEAGESIVAIPRHPLTVVDETTGWLDLSLRFMEPWIYPMGPAYTFVKAFDWELRNYPDGVRRIELPQALVVEVKWHDADEFAHWRTEGVDFTNTRLYRKLREFEVDQAIRAGTAAELNGLVRVEAPAGTHLIDFVSKHWLRRQPRPLVKHSLPASLAFRAPSPQGGRR